MQDYAWEILVPRGLKSPVGERLTALRMLLGEDVSSQLSKLT